MSSEGVIQTRDFRSSSLEETKPGGGGKKALASSSQQIALEHFHDTPLLPPFSALHIGQGIGQGVFGRSVCSPSRQAYEMKESQGDLPFATLLYCQSGEKRYPDYARLYSSPSYAELPGPLLTTILLASSHAVTIVGPDQGFQECNADVRRREDFLKAQRNLMASGSYQPAEERDGGMGDLTLEDMKRKLSLLTAHRKRQRAQTNIAHYPPITPSDPTFFGHTTDTYAFDHIKGQKPGTPNADSFFAHRCGNMISFAVADGIGWGVNSRRAAQASLLGFRNTLCEYLVKKMGSRVDSGSLLTACESALWCAHQSVFCYSEAKTTLCGGMLLPLDSPPVGSFLEGCSPQEGDRSSSVTRKRARWLFVGCSVGDSLIYRYSASQGLVQELTASDRSGGVRDAGGSLGGPEPDFRNLTYHLCLAEEGDLFLAVSDGVHDNLDPETMKWTMEEAGMCEEGVPSQWYELDADTKNAKKRRFKEQRMVELIHSCDERTPQVVTEAIIRQIEAITSDHRKAYENGSLLQLHWDSMDQEERDQMGKSVQAGLKHPKGKFDHVTCLCVSVGQP